MSKLTPKQDLFCREYLIDLNGTQAAIRAGYSVKTANETAARMLANVSIQVRISELMKEREQRIDRAADEVLKRVWEVADLKLVGDTGSIVDGVFQVTDSATWSDATKRVVRSVGYKQNGDITIKAPEVMSALVELMKHYGLTNDFNQAIACLRKYGLVIKQGQDGKWLVEDINR